MSDDRPLDLVSAALVECQGKIKGAKMDATNPFFKSRYATLGAVIEASREALYASGLAMQQILTVQDGLVTVHTVIRHKSGQWLDGGTMSLPIGESERNSDAQITGSIATYLKRYSWASNLGVYSDEDDDGHSAPKGAIPRKTPLNAPPAPPQDTSAPTVAVSPEDQKRLDDWAKYRMKVLNALQAAPGQPNRVLLTDFLTELGTLEVSQVLEDWPIKSLPKDAKAIAKLKEEMEKWHMANAQRELEAQQ